MLNIEEIKSTLSQNGYEYIENVGSGAYSRIILCKSLQYNQQFAVKVVAKHQMSTQEYNALISLDHPHIIKLYTTFSDANSQYLVMEYCSNGSIIQKGKLEYNKFMYYAKQILEALNYCHSKRIAHRDIKPDNIFVDQYDHVKLADFGLAKRFESQAVSAEKCGTLMFSAPETLQKKEVSPFKADIWALGITFFYMATGEYPFHYRTREELIDTITIGNLDFSNVLLDKRIRFLIIKMTDKDQVLRYSADKLLKLPMFSSDFNRRSSHFTIIFPNKLAAKVKTSSPEFGVSGQKSFTLGSVSQKDHIISACQPQKIHSYRSVFISPPGIHKKNFKLQPFTSDS